MSLSEVIGDTMYLHQALVQPDRHEFIKAMVREINTHQEQKHWAVTPVEEVPKAQRSLTLFGRCAEKEESAQVKSASTKRD